MLTVRTAGQGGTLFSELDGIQPLERDPLAPFRMSVIDKYKDMGTIVMGKSEAGIVRKGDRLYVMPNKCDPPSPGLRPRCTRDAGLAQQSCYAAAAHTLCCVPNARAGRR